MELLRRIRPRIQMNRKIVAFEISQETNRKNGKSNHDDQE